MSAGETYTRPTKRRKNSNSGITREELLETGREMLLEQGFDETLHLRLTEVTKRAGRTTGAAYQVWPKQLDFHKDLAQYVIERDAFAAAQVVSDDAVAALASGADMGEVARIAGADYLTQQLAGKGHEIYIRYAAIAMHDAAMREQLRPGLNAFHDAFKSVYAGALEHFGRVVRPEYTMDDLTLAISTLADGYTTRVGVMPEAFRPIERNGKEWTILACAIEAIVLAFTQEKSAA